MPEDVASPQRSASPHDTVASIARMPTEKSEGTEPGRARRLSEGLSEGQLVQITGLTGRSDLNGERAFVLGPANETGRYPVKLLPSAASVEISEDDLCKLLRPVNLRPSEGIPLLSLPLELLRQCLLHAAGEGGSPSSCRPIARLACTSKALHVAAADIWPALSLSLLPPFVLPKRRASSHAASKEAHTPSELEWHLQHLNAAPHEPSRGASAASAASAACRAAMTAATLAWQPACWTLPVARYAAGSIVWRGRLILFGGRGANGFHSNSLHVAELTESPPRWWVPTTGGEVPVGRRLHSMSVDSADRLLLLGGSRQSENEPEASLGDFLALQLPRPGEGDERGPGGEASAPPSPGYRRVAGAGAGAAAGAAAGVASAGVASDSAGAANDMASGVANDVPANAVAHAVGGMPASMSIRPAPWSWTRLRPPPCDRQLDRPPVLFGQSLPADAQAGGERAHPWAFYAHTATWLPPVRGSAETGDMPQAESLLVHGGVSLRFGIPSNVASDGLHNAPVAQAEHIAALVQMGGVPLPVIAGSPLRYDLTDGSWSEVACTGTHPVPTFRHTATLLSERRLLVFWGGYTWSRLAHPPWIDDMPTSEVVLLDLHTYEWSKPLQHLRHARPSRAFVPDPRGGHSAVRLGTKLLCFGGVSPTLDGGERDRDDGFVLETAPDNPSRWSYAPLPLAAGKPPSARSSHAAHLVPREYLDGSEREAAATGAAVTLLMLGGREYVAGETPEQDQHNARADVHGLLLLDAAGGP